MNAIPRSRLSDAIESISVYAAGVASSIEDGLAKAGVAITAGAACAKLDQFVHVTRQIGTS